MDGSPYTAESTELLSGLEPVRRGPGMYTDTTGPNHLGQEFIDNSVDEAITGFADRIDVLLRTDGSLEVRDNGRGIPVDIHPEEGVPGAELILSKLHAGSKFSNESYRFSGGLHGVGVLVVNALSAKLEATVRRDGKEYRIEFTNGEKVGELEAMGAVDLEDTGTTIRFWPDSSFDSAFFFVSRLVCVLHAKAVLYPGVQVSFEDKNSEEREEWHFEAGHVVIAMPPLYRIDTEKEVHHALDRGERQGVLARIAVERKKGRANIRRFKGLGERNPMQLRETVMAPDTRRLVQPTVEV